MPQRWTMLEQAPVAMTPKQTGGIAREEAVHFVGRDRSPDCVPEKRQRGCSCIVDQARDGTAILAPVHSCDGRPLDRKDRVPDQR